VDVGSFVRGSSLEVSPFPLFERLPRQSAVLIFRDAKSRKYLDVRAAVAMS
jgi:hypothetical protein